MSHGTIYFITLKKLLAFQNYFFTFFTARLKCNFGWQVVLDFFLYQKRATSASNHQNMLQHELNCSLLSVISRTFGKDNAAFLRFRQGFIFWKICLRKLSMYFLCF